jgi:hypothetical protein
LVRAIPETQTSPLPLAGEVAPTGAGEGGATAHWRLQSRLRRERAVPPARQRASKCDTTFFHPRNAPGRNIAPRRQRIETHPTLRETR